MPVIYVVGCQASGDSARVHPVSSPVVEWSSGSTAGHGAATAPASDMAALHRALCEAVAALECMGANQQV